jgi:hypothetical protein
MKNTIIIITLLVAILTLPEVESVSAQTIKNKSDARKNFNVVRTSTPIIIDGKPDDLAWSETEVGSLDYFYNIKKPDDKQNTSFRMLWDEENLYVFFECKDQYITARETERNGEPYFDDCAEIFLIPAPDSAKMHFGFELNLYKASNDFIFLNDIYQGKDAVLKAFDPEFEVEVTHSGTINDNSDIDEGWTIEMAIPLKLFVGMNEFSPVKAGNTWYFLAVRQDRNDADGNRRSTSTIFPIYDDGVHAPNRFGALEFVE